MAPQPMAAASDQLQFAAGRVGPERPIVSRDRRSEGWGKRTIPAPQTESPGPLHLESDVEPECPVIQFACASLEEADHRAEWNGRLRRADQLHGKPLLLEGPPQCSFTGAPLEDGRERAKAAGSDYENWPSVCHLLPRNNANREECDADHGDCRRGAQAGKSSKVAPSPPRPQCRQREQVSGKRDRRPLVCEAQGNSVLKSGTRNLAFHGYSAPTAAVKGGTLGLGDVVDLTTEARRNPESHASAGSSTRPDLSPTSLRS